MLADRPRLDVYAEAIRRHVARGQGVVDVGTGNGVLACLAARRGAHVWAVDHSRGIERAQRVAEANGLAIEFVHSPVGDFDPGRRLDVIVHDMMSNALFNDGLIEHIASLRERALRPGGRILPHRFELFIVPVEPIPTRASRSSGSRASMV